MTLNNVSFHLRIAVYLQQKLEMCLNYEYEYIISLRMLMEDVAQTDA